MEIVLVHDLHWRYVNYIDTATDAVAMWNV